MGTVKGSLTDRVERRQTANGASLNGKSIDQPQQPASRPSSAMWSSFQPWVPGHIWASVFTVTDNLRRAQGEALGALGYGPSECDHVAIATGPHWSLRDYKGPGAGLPVLIVAAPIKQPYI